MEKVPNCQFYCDRISSKSGSERDQLQQNPTELKMFSKSCRRIFCEIIGISPEFTQRFGITLPLNPANISILKVNNRNTSKRCEICLKWTMKTPERYFIINFWADFSRFSSVSIINFVQVNVCWERCALSMTKSRKNVRSKVSLSNVLALASLKKLNFSLGFGGLFDSAQPNCSARVWRWSTRKSHGCK